MSISACPTTFCASSMFTQRLNQCCFKYGFKFARILSSDLTRHQLMLLSLLARRSHHNILKVVIVCLLFKLLADIWLQDSSLVVYVSRSSFQIYAALDKTNRGPLLTHSTIHYILLTPLSFTIFLAVPATASPTHGTPGNASSTNPPARRPSLPAIDQRMSSD